MNKVSLIYSKNLSDQTGASAVMRTLNDSKPLFRNYDIDLNVYSREMMMPKGGNTNQSVKNKKSYKDIIASVLQYLSKEIPLAAYALSYIRSMRPSKRLVAYMDGKIGKEDILFFHEIYTAYYYLKKYGKKNKVVLVIHNDGRDFYLESIRYRHFENSIYHKKLNQMLHFVLCNADRVGFVSSISVDNFKGLHPDFPNNKLFVAYNGLPKVAPLPVKENNRMYRLVCVGTVIVSKGQQFIIEAFKKMKTEGKDMSNISCTIVGGGPNLDCLQEDVRRNDLCDSIIFTGPTNEVSKYLAVSNIFILPSTSEGLPMSILEAMRAGLPIVSTKVGGVPETIIDGETGMIIDASEEGVYSCLSNLDKYDWAKMANGSYNYYLNKFTDDSMVKTYSSIFNSL